MRSTFLCVLTLLVYTLWFDRRDPPTCDSGPDDTVLVVEPFYQGRLCHRKLYPSYLGNSDRNCWTYVGDPYPLPYDRHLYPSYLGNADRGREYDSPRIMRRVDVRDLPCEHSMYPGYIGNTLAWNECRRAKGLLTPHDR